MCVLRPHLLTSVLEFGHKSGHGWEVRSEGWRFVLVVIWLPEDKEGDERLERTLKG